MATGATCTRETGHTPPAGARPSETGIFHSAIPRLCRHRVFFTSCRDITLTAIVGHTQNDKDTLWPVSTEILCTGGGLNVIRKEAWLLCRTSSGVCLCWELEKPKGTTGFRDVILGVSARPEYYTSSRDPRRLLTREMPGTNTRVPDPSEETLPPRLTNLSGQWLQAKSMAPTFAESLDQHPSILHVLNRDPNAHALASGTLSLSHTLSLSLSLSLSHTRSRARERAPVARRGHRGEVGPAAVVWQREVLETLD